MIGDNIAERLVDVAARTIRAASALPRTAAGKHIADQLLRCGTAPGACYEEARGAESRRDFVHKLGIARKEMHEARYWLRVAVRAGLFESSLLSGLLQELDELSAILGKSVLTARTNSKQAPG
ncbi:hypothetical protein RAS1_37180 [Phycisphaerae bacterium RAS1]|nr:hypothetical protein RAS1_37180 [Phycisphaerae bacterium RAS1]